MSPTPPVRRARPGGLRALALAALAAAGCGDPPEAPEAPVRPTRCELLEGAADVAAARRALVGRRGGLAVCFAMTPDRAEDLVLRWTIASEPDGEGGRALTAQPEPSGAVTPETRTCLEGAGSALAEAVGAGWPADRPTRVRCDVPIEPPR